MKSISKSRLKSRMLGIFRDLEQHGGELVVTDHGRPVLKITPLQAPAPTAAEAFADLRGKIQYHRDPLEATSAEWAEV